MSKPNATRRFCQDCRRLVGVRVRQPRGRQPGRVIFYEHNRTPRSGPSGGGSVSNRCPNSGCHA